MDFTASHIGFVLASYGLSLVLILGLVIYVIARDRRLCAEARRLDTNRRTDQA